MKFWLLCDVNSLKAGWLNEDLTALVKEERRAMWIEKHGEMTE